MTFVSLKGGDRGEGLLSLKHCLVGVMCQSDIHTSAKDSQQHIYFKEMKCIHKVFAILEE